MNEKIMEALGFGYNVSKFKQGICTMCKKEIKEEDFIDELSKKEYTISGLCQKCQDEFFGTSDDKDDTAIEEYEYQKLNK